MVSSVMAGYMFPLLCLRMVFVVNHYETLLAHTVSPCQSNLTRTV